VADTIVFIESDRPMSRDAEIRKLRTVLLLRRDAIRKALAGDLGALMELREQGGSDAIDYALDAEHGEVSSQLAEFESRELAQIERALERFEDGTYGICEVTGKPIPLSRLRALPYATMRIEAQRELEQAREEGRELPNWAQAADFTPDDAPPMANDFELT
jgi:DnaK suppressor protein